MLVEVDSRSVAPFCGSHMRSCDFESEAFNISLSCACFLLSSGFLWLFFFFFLNWTNLIQLQSKFEMCNVMQMIGIIIICLCMC